MDLRLKLNLSIKQKHTLHERVINYNFSIETGELFSVITISLTIVLCLSAVIKILKYSILILLFKYIYCVKCK